MLVAVVNGDAVRNALSNAEPVTTALQPLTAVRPCNVARTVNSVENLS